MSNETENKSRVRAFFAAMNKGDIEGFLRLYDKDGSCWTSGHTLISGTLTIDTITAGAGAIFDAFPEGITFTIHAMTAEGDRVAVEAESHGIHKSGKLYNNLYHFLFIFRGDRILQLKEYMDTELVTDILCGGQRPAAD